MIYNYNRREKANGSFASEYDAFIGGAAWKKCSKSYAKSKRKLCEDCLERGECVPYEQVHHMIKLTPENIHDPNVSLNWKNLRCLCRECHDKREGKRKLRTNEWGHVELE